MGRTCARVDRSVRCCPDVVVGVVVGAVDDDVDASADVDDVVVVKIGSEAVLSLVEAVVVVSGGPFISITVSVPFLGPCTRPVPVCCPTAMDWGRGRGMRSGEEEEGGNLVLGTRMTGRPPVTTMTALTTKVSRLVRVSGRIIGAKVRSGILTRFRKGQTFHGNGRGDRNRNNDRNKGRDRDKRVGGIAGGVGVGERGDFRVGSRCGGLVCRWYCCCCRWYCC